MIWVPILFSFLFIINAHPIQNKRDYKGSSSPLPNFFKFVSPPLKADDLRDIEKYLEKLNKVTSSNATSCDKCIEELKIGKELVAIKSYLIPPVFTKWCLDNEILKDVDCESNYGRITVDTSTMGVDFGNLLNLMEPDDIDGEFYCHYKRNACEIPQLPELNLDDWFPAKPENAQTPEPSGELINVLHISDHHLQLNYTVGSEANCTDYGMCCNPHSFNENQLPTNHFRESTMNNYSSSVYHNAFYDDDMTFHLGDTISTKNTSVWRPALPFGSYGCDSPELLVNSSLKSIYDFQKEKYVSFEFAIFTGDLVDHAELQYSSFDLIVKEEENLFRDMKHYLSDIPVYSVMGNHDSYPYGQIAQESSGFENKYTWNAELMAHLWKDYDWIDNETAQEVKTHYCGYSVNAQKRLKIIALNSNTYYQKNLYSYWNMSNPDSFGQIRFLIEELLEAERNNQRAWIIAHIPFINYDALPLPAKLYVEVIKRFSPHVIAGIFFGHTHHDEFQILYADSGKNIDDALAFSWTSQSVAPIYKQNPGWRYYAVDAGTFEIMESFNYYTQLSDTINNNGQEPIWKFLYDPRNSYDVDWPRSSPLNATYWAKVAESLKNNDEASKFANFTVRNSAATPDCSKGECENYYCYTTSFTYLDYINCIENSP